MLIDYVVELLGDGKWHYTRSLARKLDQPEDRIRDILRFLADFDFAALDATGNRARIHENLRRLLATNDILFPQDSR
jgi:hypothetical protein